MIKCQHNMGNSMFIDSKNFIKFITNTSKHSLDKISTMKEDIINSITFNSEIYPTIDTRIPFANSTPMVFEIHFNNNYYNANFSKLLFTINTFQGIKSTINLNSLYFKINNGMQQPAIDNAFFILNTGFNPIASLNIIINKEDIINNKVTIVFGSNDYNSLNKTKFFIYSNSIFLRPIYENNVTDTLISNYEYGKSFSTYDGSYEGNIFMYSGSFIRNFEKLNNYLYCINNISLTAEEIEYCCNMGFINEDNKDYNFALPLSFINNYNKIFWLDSTLNRTFYFFSKYIYVQQNNYKNGQYNIDIYRYKNYNEFSSKFVMGNELIQLNNNDVKFIYNNTIIEPEQHVVDVFNSICFKVLNNDKVYNNTIGFMLNNSNVQGMDIVLYLTDLDSSKLTAGSRYLRIYDMHLSEELNNAVLFNKSYRIDDKIHYTIMRIKIARTSENGKGKIILSYDTVLAEEVNKYVSTGWLL